MHTATVSVLVDQAGVFVVALATLFDNLICLVLRCTLRPCITLEVPSERLRENRCLLGRAVVRNAFSLLPEQVIGLGASQWLRAWDHI